MLNAAPLEHHRQQLGLLHAHGADEDGLPLRVPLRDVLDHRVELRLRGLVDHVGLVRADHRLVGRDRDDAELVDLHELVGLGHRRAGHARELFVEPEVVLQRDRGEGLVLVLDLHAFLGLDGLVHALVVPAAVQDAAGELVHDEDLAVHHDVVLVLLEQLLGLERVLEERHERGVDRVVQVVDAEPVLDLLHARLEDADGLLLLVDLVVALAVLAAPQPGGDLGELGVPAGVLLGRAGDDQRRPRLVDQDRVHLVDDGEVVAALHGLLKRPRHVVAQVVEAELVVRAVGDVGGVGLLPVGRRHVGQDHPDLEAEEAVHPPHPLRVALGQVVVGRDDVHALARQRVQVGGEHAGERLALTSAHLGDVAEVQRRRAHQLHVEGALAERAARRLADRGERLGQDVVKRLAVVGEPPLELVGHPAQLGVAHRDEVVLNGVDLLADPLELTQDLAFAGAKDAV